MAGTHGRGRRKGQSGAKEAILDSARKAFAEAGYAGTSIRTIAVSAEVDPALIHHYFGSKEGLFTAAMQLPVNPGQLIDGIVGSVSRDDVGAALVRALLAIWDNPATMRPLLALLRSAVSHEESARMLREFMIGAVLSRVVADLGADQQERRAALIGSQLVGLAIMRHVLKVPEITSASVNELAATVGPTVQRYLTAGLPKAA